MADVKTISTRIINRFDTLANWQKHGVELLPGEIALVKVTTQEIDEDTGNVVNVPAILLKVGEADNTGKPVAFDMLPWLSAKASDVYNWAKSATIEEVMVTITSGDTVIKQSLSTWIKNALKDLNTHDSLISNNTSKISELESTQKTTKDTLDTVADWLIAIAADGSTVDNYFIDADSAVVTITDSKLKAWLNRYNFLDEKNRASASFLIDLLGAQLLLVDTRVTANTENISSLEDRVETNESLISNINQAISGGVHFIGITTTTLSDGSTAQNISIDGKSTPVKLGDITLVKNAKDLVNKEFIWDGSAWRELGDQSLLGELHTKINNMTVVDTEEPSNFVTAVSQTQGKITVTKKQPTSTDISHNTYDTVENALEAHDASIANLNSKLSNMTSDVPTAISTAINTTLNSLNVGDPYASGNATAFINTAKQTNGKLVVTKAALPTATTSTAGITKLGASGGAATYEDLVGLSNYSNELSSHISLIGSTYIKYNNIDNKLYLGESGADELIFDCGGAPI